MKSRNLIAAMAAGTAAPWLLAVVPGDNGPLPEAALVMTGLFSLAALVVWGTQGMREIRAYAEDPARR